MLRSWDLLTSNIGSIVSRNAFCWRAEDLLLQMQTEMATKAMISRVAGTTEPAIATTCEVCPDAVDVAVLVVVLVDEVDPFDCVVAPRVGTYAFDDWTVI